MENEAVNDFLGEVENQAPDVFAPAADDITTPDDTTTPPAGDDKDEKLPFHKDPAVQKYIEKRVEKGIEKKLKDIKPSTEQEFRRDTAPTDTDDYYARLIGNDTPEKVAMIREAKQRDAQLLQDAEDRAFARLNKNQQDQIREQQAAEAELAEQFDNVEEAYGVDLTSNAPGARKARQEFVTFIERVAPKNGAGEIIAYPDLVETFEVFQSIKKQSTVPNRAKDLASRGLARSSETVATAAPKERITWDTVNRLFG